MHIIFVLLALASGAVIVSGAIWSEWGDFGPCTPLHLRARKHDLNLGSQTRSRNCLENDPKENEEEINDEDEFKEECEREGMEQIERLSCRVATEWSRFRRSDKCSVSCGEGTSSFKRSCVVTNPKKAQSNETCILGSVDVIRKACQEAPCPVDGNWSEWSTWSSCYSSECIFTKKTEQRGHQYRIRTCSNPFPNHGGKMCEGVFLVYGNCTEPKNCPVNGGWSRWSEYGIWNCLSGHRNRTRKCDSPLPQNGGSPCQGNYIEFLDKSTDLKRFNSTCGTVPLKPGDGNDQSTEEERAEEDEEEDEEDLI